MTIQGLSYTAPSTWPLWARRLFVIALPITAPLWLTSLIAIYVVAVCICLPLMLLWIAQESVRGWWKDRSK